MNYFMEDFEQNFTSYSKEEYVKKSDILQIAFKALKCPKNINLKFLFN